MPFGLAFSQMRIRRDENLKSTNQERKRWENVQFKSLTYGLTNICCHDLNPWQPIQTCFLVCNKECREIIAIPRVEHGLFESFKNQQIIFGLANLLSATQKRDALNENCESNEMSETKLILPKNLLSQWIGKISHRLFICSQRFLSFAKCCLELVIHTVIGNLITNPSYFHLSEKQSD